MEPHIEISELIRLRDGAQPPAQAKELRAHLRDCAECRDELEQLEMNDALAADLRALREANLTPIPEEVDRRVWASLVESIKPGSSRSRKSSSRAGRKRPHADAPRIPDYTLHRRIGQGAFGEVWEAQDRTGLACAVKVLQHEARQYEIQGITQARKFSHPNLVAIRHVGLYRRRLYYVMEFVPESLAARLAASQPFPVDEVLKHIRSLLDALAACHAAGLAHRDIKPENIGFAADGTLKLLDLGLVTGADRTDATRVGTPLYMPLMPGTTPAYDDLYAAGRVLYFMLTGEKPPAELPALTAVERGAGELACRLHQAARKAAATNPASRFASANEFLAAINPDLPRKKSPGAACNPFNGSSGTTTQTQDMNSTQQSLTEAAKVLSGIGQRQRQQILLQEAARLNNPHYKAAVVGEFKVGKSNLVNHALLKGRVLFTDVLAATAVPTEIVQGDTPQLEVYPNLLQQESVVVEGGSATVEVPVAEGKPEIISNPTPEIIHAKTAVVDADPSIARAKRAAMARQTARVRLQWPAPALGTYSIVDTPGINEPNDAVIATTYRVIPEADVTIFVMVDKAMGDLERNFLRSKVFERGMSRCLIVVNASRQKPQVHLDKVVGNIRANLSQIGREYVPVETVFLPPPVDGSGKLPEPSPEEKASLEKFEVALRDFLDRNVEAGRRERSRNVLTREAKLACAECAVELAALGKTPAELEELERKINHEGREFQRRYRKICQEFLRDLQNIQRVHWQKLAAGLDKIAQAYAAGFEGLVSLSDIQNRLQTVDSHLRPPVEQLFFSVADETLADIRQLEEKYQSEFQDEADSWLQSVQGELKVDGGWLAKLPPPLVFIADVITTHILMPGGWIAAIIERWVLSKIPLVRDLLPSRLAAKLVAGIAKAQVLKQIDDSKSATKAKLDAAYSDARQRLSENWETNGEEKLQTILGPLKRAAQESKNPEREKQLKEAITALNKVFSRAD